MYGNRIIEDDLTWFEEEEEKGKTYFDVFRSSL
jgi:hypothetical protein